MICSRWPKRYLLLVSYLMLAPSSTLRALLKLQECHYWNFVPSQSTKCHRVIGFFSTANKVSFTLPSKLPRRQVKRLLPSDQGRQNYVAKEV